MTKRVLLVAFHFPPYRGGSGIHRTLKATRYLPDYGWHPSVLTASPRAYPSRGDAELHEIPGDVPVVRAFALDAARQLSVKGRYFQRTALPDRWMSWWFGAIPAGLRLIRRHRPDAIWSTFPIVTAHRIGLTLSRLSGLPWVADFRDSMTEDNYPRDLATRAVCQRVERETVERSRRAVFTTESTRQMYVDRYPHVPPERLLVIPNGYDEEDFAAVDAGDRSKRVADRPLRLIHAGLLYPEERDPRPFFKAVAKLQAEGALTHEDVAIDLRASGAEPYYEALIRDLGIGNLVRLLPSLPHREALRDAAGSDALLLFQSASCNHQIPAKVYEYLRLRRPILALTSHQGDTAGVLRSAGGATIVDIADTNAIYEALPEFLRVLRAKTHPLAPFEVVQRYSRRRQVGDLARCLDAAIA